MFNFKSKEMKKSYVLVLYVFLLTVTSNAQTLTKLGVRFSEDTSLKLNSVVGFDPATTYYEVILPVTQMVVPKVEATPAEDCGTQVTQASSIIGTESERTATVVVTKGEDTQTYTVVFVKSDSFIEGFTEEGSGVAGSFYLDGEANHGEQVGNRSCRTSNNANASYWTFTVPSAGILTFYITQDNLNNSKKLSTFQIKKSKDGKTGWVPLMSEDAATYEFPEVGEWKKVEIPVNEEGEVYIQFAVTKTGTTRDFRFDDVVITPYSEISSVLNEVSDNGIIAYAVDGKIYVDSDVVNDKYVVCDLSGKLVCEGRFSGSVAVSIEKGIYLVKTSAGVAKVMVR